ncbi:sec-independent protein translocase protein TatA [Symbiobacterium terraclitae]|uniref:Sec-independent protein translocase protein TatA n=1 Tax=Symbiobacterium terraclitae TaxID=557451 RepID=A0ABS4JTL6_9FIRM|nr:twin-arginine translocase TatA/TatE family subunit [Symbiobacterium terraclitae]MBP2018873.1 sec-independent protein translocase protein TatA [Symbiobacterium terraclitae]
MLQRIGPMEIALIVIVLLLIFGPSKLPQLGKSIGDTIREFRSSMKSARGDEPESEEPKDPESDKKG